MTDNTTTNGRIDRRTYLKIAGTGALATSVAGCLGLGGDRSGSQNDDTTDSNSGGGASGKSGKNNGKVTDSTADAATGTDMTETETNERISTGTETSEGVETTGSTVENSGTTTENKEETAVGGNTNSEWAYTTYLYRPGAIGSYKHYDFQTTDVETLVANKRYLNPETYRSYKNGTSVSWKYEIESAGLQFTDIENGLSFPGTGAGANAVVRATVDVKTVESELTKNGFSKIGNSNGYPIYLGPKKTVAIGISDTELISGRKYGSVNAKSAVETIIETKTGSSDRYVRSSKDFQLLVEHLGFGTLVSGGTHKPREKQVANGIARVIKGKMADFRAAFVYESADVITAKTKADHRSLFESITKADLTARVSGRTVIIEGPIRTETI